MLRQLLLLPVFALLLSGASCSLTPSGFAVDAGDNEAAPSDDACPVDQIEAQGEQTCATCDYGTICGVADEAPCEVRENSQGDACQLCITSTGDVLFDDCFIQGEVDSAVCEPSPSDDPTKTCTTCFDALGAAVSTTCTPVSDSCSDETIDGRACRVCSRAGEVVSTTCDSADLDPRTCVAYGNDVGRCVDCFGDDGAIIIHTCSERLEDDTGGELGTEGNPSPPAPSCEQRVVDGVSCTVCYDDTGAFLNQTCSEGAPASQRCERLEFTEQVCQVCVDSNNAVTFVDCVDSACSVDTACRSDADCFDNQACYDGVCTARAGDEESAPNPGLADCPEPPTCEMFNNRDGQLCRACPTSTGTTEVRCMSNTSLVCDVVSESELPPAVSNSVAEERPTTDAAGERNAGRSCVLCTSPTLNVEVYRDCEGNGAVPPPACVETTTVDNAVCTACFDAVTGDTVYSSCAAAAGDDVCYGHSEHVLVDAAGLSDELVACKTCNDGVQTTTCALASVCGDGLTADPSACTGTATLRLTPQLCGNPWQDYRSSFDRDDDLAAVMSWSRAAGGVVVQGATAQAGPNAACTVDDCSCARGDVIDVVVAAGDRAAAERFFTNAGVL